MEKHEPSLYLPCHWYTTIVDRWSCRNKEEKDTDSYKSYLQLKEFLHFHCQTWFAFTTGEMSDLLPDQNSLLSCRTPSIFKCMCIKEKKDSCFVVTKLCTFDACPVKPLQSVVLLHSWSPFSQQKKKWLTDCLGKTTTFLAQADVTVKCCYTYCQLWQTAVIVCYSV